LGLVVDHSAKGKVAKALAVWESEIALLTPTMEQRVDGESEKERRGLEGRKNSEELLLI
jgi:phage baseplate assembly protein W